MTHFFDHVATYDSLTTTIIIKPLVTSTATLSLVTDFGVGGVGSFNLSGTLTSVSSNPGVSRTVLTPVNNILNSGSPMGLNVKSINLNPSFLKTLLCADLTKGTAGLQNLQTNLALILSGGFGTPASTQPMPFSTTISPIDNSLAQLIKEILAGSMTASFTQTVSKTGFFTCDKIILTPNTSNQITAAIALGGKAFEGASGRVVFINPKPVGYTPIPNGKFKPVFPEGPNSARLLIYHLINAATVTSGVEPNFYQNTRFYYANCRLNPSSQGPYVYNKPKRPSCLFSSWTNFWECSLLRFCSTYWPKRGNNTAM
jgi:hypothetical protein